MKCSVKKSFRNECDARRRWCRLPSVNMTPAIPGHGFGMAGEIIPLAHAVQPRIGEGRVFADDGSIQSAKDWYAEHGTVPYEPLWKEGLSLISGTRVGPAWAWHLGREAAVLLATANLAHPCPAPGEPGDRCDPRRGVPDHQRPTRQDPALSGRRKLRHRRVRTRRRRPTIRNERSPVLPSGDTDPAARHPSRRQRSRSTRRPTSPPAPARAEHPIQEAIQSRRRSVTQAVSSWRLDSCSLRSTADTWVSIVFTERCNCVATSRYV
jgi:Aromatic amino acid lyase